jgi:phage-related protein
MQAIVDTIFNSINVLTAFLMVLFQSVATFFNSILQLLVNFFNALTAFLKEAFASFKSFFEAIFKSITNVYDAVIYFFKDVFKSIKSFFDACLETVKNAYDTVITYGGNVIDSLAYFLIDLPLLVWKKVFDAVLWLFEWASNSCEYCIGAAQNVGSLAGSFHSIWDDIASYGSTLLYCLNRAGVQEALQILTCGFVIWSILKVVSFIKAIL